MQKNGFTMSGTESTSVFSGVQKFTAGSLGYRSLGGSSYRIRVVPTGIAPLTFDSNWKTPGGGQNRFSVVVNSVEELVQNTNAAVRVLAAASIVEVPAQPAVAAVPAYLTIA